MNISKLKVGMKVKNYVELCELLGVKIRKGGQKPKQLQDFKKYFDWNQEERAFIITQIYNKPKAFTENEMIELLLLHLLATSEHPDKCTVVSTKRNIFEKLQMVNRNFKYCVSHPNQLAVYKNIPEDIVVETVESIDDSLDNKLNTTLKRLTDRKIIFSYDVYMICYNSEVEDIANKDGKNYHRIATDEECKLCIGIEGDILKELGCSEYKDVKIKKKEAIYKRKLDEAFENIDVECFYRAIKIVFIERRIPDMIDKLIYKYKLSQKNHKKYGISINNYIQSNTNKNAKNRYKNAKKELENVNNTKEKQEHDNPFEEYNILLNLGVIDESYINQVDEVDEGEYTYISEAEYYEQEKQKRKIESELGRLEKLNMRATDEYLNHVNELVKLLVDIKTPSCIEDIKNEYSKHRNKKCQ